MNYFWIVFCRVNLVATFLLREIYEQESFYINVGVVNSVLSWDVCFKDILSTRVRVGDRKRENNSHRHFY